MAAASRFSRKVSEHSEKVSDVQETVSFVWRERIVIQYSPGGRPFNNKAVRETHLKS